MGANFGIVGTDWQQRVNWDRLRECPSSEILRQEAS